jgi:gliding motility-associated-like protein
MLTFVIQSVASPQIGSITTVDPSCLASDGQIDITMIGATSGLTYSINGGTTFQPVSSFPSLGVGSYLVVVQNPQGCFVDTLVVLINPNSPVFDAVNVTEPSCGMSDGSISINLSGGVMPYSYSIDNGATYQSSNTFTGLAGGVYDISVKDASGCTSTVTIYIVPGTLPAITLVQAVQPPCLGDSGCISIYATGGIAPLTYSFDNGITFSTDSSKCGLLPGLYNLVVQGVNGCTVSYQETIAAQDSVIANFTLNPTTGQSPLSVDFTNTSTNASNYFWSFGDGDSSLIVNPNHVFDPKGDYTVILTATHGNCTDTMSVVIHVESDSYIFVPNFFSPNNDGSNDFFQLVSYQGISTLTCVITNEWGNEMATFNSPDFAWNGNNQSGVPANDGVYYYHIVAQGTDGQIYNLQGFFHLQSN